MKKKLLFLLLSLLTLTISAQSELIITMVTTQGHDSYFDFELQPARPNTTISVDFGDGKLIKHTMDDIDDTYQISGYLKSDTIKVYGNVYDIVGFKCLYNELTTLDISKNKFLKVLLCYKNKIQTLDLTQNKNLKKINCEKNKLDSLDISKNLYLEYLECSYNNIAILDVNNNTALKNLICSSNQLSQLDVSNNALLEELKCRNNQLTKLNLSQNKELRVLFFDDNKLTDIDVSENKLLRNLYCGNNNLSVLDVSNNTYLFNLSCSNNKITRLDLLKHTQLQKLSCQENQLTELNISQNGRLDRLYCYNNQLTSIDLSSFSKLLELNCSKNQISALDLSHNEYIEVLYCQNNLLTELDVTKNTSLRILDCSNNRIPSLDISQNMRLKELKCTDNLLTSLDITNNKLIKYPSDISYTNNALDKKSIKKLESLEKNYSYNRRDFNPEFGLGVDMGYTYMPWKRNMLSIGVELVGSPDTKYPYGGRTVHMFSLGAGITGVLGKNGKAIPTFRAGYSTGGVMLIDFKVAASKYHIHPTIGLNALNIFKLHLGYSFGYKEYNNRGDKLKGFTIGINFSLGTRGYIVDPSN